MLGIGAAGSAASLPGQAPFIGSCDDARVTIASSAAGSETRLGPLFVIDAAKPDSKREAR